VPAEELPDRLIKRKHNFHTYCSHYEQELKNLGIKREDHLKLFIREEKQLSERVLTVYYLVISLPAQNRCATDRLLSEIDEVARQIVPLCAADSPEGKDEQQLRLLDCRFNICVVSASSPIPHFYVGAEKRSAPELVHTASNLQILGLPNQDATLLNALTLGLLFNEFRPNLFVQVLFFSSSIELRHEDKVCTAS
jgi:hypothetical protein